MRLMRLYSMKDNEVTRAYAVKDDVMLETANTLHSLMVQQLADFTAFDNHLNADFAAAWLQSIDAAGTVVQDHNIKAVLMQKTQEVTALMELCFLKYNEVKYFAKKVFPKNKTKQAEFGTSTFQFARKVHSRMIAFMDTLHKACLKYETELLAGGYTQNQIDEILTLQIDLLNANSAQENYSKARQVLTQERIEILNKAYQTMRTIIEAAKVIYAHNPARKNQFVFYEKRKKNVGVFELKVV